VPEVDLGVINMFVQTWGLGKKGALQAFESLIQHDIFFVLESDNVGLQVTTYCEI